MDVRRAFAFVGALAVASAIATPSWAQNRPPEQQQERRKLSGDERKELEALIALVDAVAAGKQPAPADAKLKFQHHFIRSAKNVYIPYTLEIGGAKFSSLPVAMYVRAIEKSGTVAAAAAKPGEYAFADVYFLTEKHLLPSVTTTPTANTTGNTTTSTTTATSTLSDAGTAPLTEVARALELPPGEYDLYIAMRERPSRDRKAPPPKTAVLAQTLTVPDMHKMLTTSSIIMAKSLEAAPGGAQLTGQEQLEAPYTISGYKVVPSYTSAIPKSGELLFVFFIYNEGVAASGKPDLDVDYNFFRAAEEKPFSKLATTSFNATTLPGQFDVNVGHQVFVGQGIPMTSFTPGDYKLEIKISDKTNSQVITRNVPFTVTP
jgi:hypothetical protein